MVGFSSKKSVSQPQQAKNKCFLTIFSANIARVKNKEIKNTVSFLLKCKARFLMLVLWWCAGVARRSWWLQSEVPAGLGGAGSPNALCWCFSKPLVWRRMQLVGSGLCLSLLGIPQMEVSPVHLPAWWSLGKRYLPQRSQCHICRTQEEGKLAAAVLVSSGAAGKFDLGAKVKVCG